MRMFVGTATTILDLIDMISTIKGQQDEEPTVKWEADLLNTSVDVVYDEELNTIYIYAR